MPDEQSSEETGTSETISAADYAKAQKAAERAIKARDDARAELADAKSKLQEIAPLAEQVPTLQEQLEAANAKAAELVGSIRTRDITDAVYGSVTNKLKIPAVEMAMKSLLLDADPEAPPHDVAEAMLEKIRAAMPDAFEGPVAPTPAAPRRPGVSPPEGGGMGGHATVEDAMAAIRADRSKRASEALGFHVPGIL